MLLLLHTGWGLLGKVAKEFLAFFSFLFSLFSLIVAGCFFDIYAGCMGYGEEEEERGFLYYHSGAG